MNCNTTHYRANSSSVPGDPTLTTEPKTRHWNGLPAHAHLRELLEECTDHDPKHRPQSFADVLRALGGPRPTPVASTPAPKPVEAPPPPEPAPGVTHEIPYSEAVESPGDLVEEAKRFKDAGDLSRTIELTSRALQIDPAFHPALVTRSHSYLLAGELDAALADADRLIKISPRSAGGYRIRASVYLVKMDYPNAKADAEEAVRLDPHNARGYLLRAQSRALDFDPAAVIQDCNLGLKIDPENAYLYAERAAAYLNQTDNAQAVADATEAIRRAPQYVAPYVTRASAQRWLGDLDAARADVDRAIELAPHDPAHYGLRAEISEAEDLYQLAEADLEFAIKAEPPMAWMYYGRLVHALLMQSKKNEALAWANHYVAEHPDVAEAFLSRARARRCVGNFKPAAADCEQALRVVPEYVGVAEEQELIQRRDTNYPARPAETESTGSSDEFELSLSEDGPPPGDDASDFELTFDDE